MKYPYAKFDLLRSKHIVNEQIKFLDKYKLNGRIIETIENQHNYAESIKNIIRLLRPYTAEEGKKVRIGGEGDGGYVMLAPGKGGIAYSFGVSKHSPWDFDMANRGFKVYQYDASIEEEPDKHPNIFFNKYFIASSPTPDGPCKTITQVLSENNHEHENDIILQMDIEGSEWDFFSDITVETMLKFKQLIIELHHINDSPEKYNILKKIRQTHTPIHYHYNNNTRKCVYFPKANFIYSEHVIEVSFVRSNDFNFIKCNDYFPTNLDNRNNKKWPEIPIGYFDLILNAEWQ